jgi:UDP-N-acetylglucosamine 2-epimerase (non-hydrolysing)
MQALDVLSRQLPVVFPVHPRTRRRVLDLGIATEGKDVQLIEPLGYLDFLAFQARAALVVTDSGGVQEEATYLGIPCLTLRPNTERPVTISQGTNQLVSSTQNALIDAVERTLQRYSQMDPATTPRPALWDGHTAERIVAVLQQVAA